PKELPERLAMAQRPHHAQGVVDEGCRRPALERLPASVLASRSACCARLDAVTAPSATDAARRNESPSSTGTTRGGGDGGPTRSSGPPGGSVARPAAGHAVTRPTGLIPAAPARAPAPLPAQRRGSGLASECDSRSGRGGVRGPVRPERE